MQDRYGTHTLHQSLHLSTAEASASFSLCSEPNTVVPMRMLQSDMPAIVWILACIDHTRTLSVAKQLRWSLQASHMETAPCIHNVQCRRNMLFCKVYNVYDLSTGPQQAPAVRQLRGGRCMGAGGALPLRHGGRCETMPGAPVREAL